MILSSHFIRCCCFSKTSNSKHAKPTFLLAFISSTSRHWSGLFFSDYCYMSKLVHHAKSALDVGKHRHRTVYVQTYKIRMQQYLMFKSLNDSKINTSMQWKILRSKSRCYSQYLNDHVALTHDFTLTSSILTMTHSNRKIYINVITLIYDLSQLSFTNNCFLLTDFIFLFLSFSKTQSVFFLFAEWSSISPNSFFSLSSFDSFSQAYPKWMIYNIFQKKKNIFVLSIFPVWYTTKSDDFEKENIKQRINGYFIASHFVFLFLFVVFEQFVFHLNKTELQNMRNFLRRDSKNTDRKWINDFQQSLLSLSIEIYWLFYFSSDQLAEHALSVHINRGNLNGNM